MGFCINCDNRHGCKLKTPPCIITMREKNIKDKCGKEYLIETKQLKLCRECDFFRICWNESDYEKSFISSS